MRLTIDDFKELSGKIPCISDDALTALLNTNNVWIDTPIKEIEMEYRPITELIALCTNAVSEGYSNVTIEDGVLICYRDITLADKIAAVEHYISKTIFNEIAFLKRQLEYRKKANSDDIAKLETLNFILNNAGL